VPPNPSVEARPNGKPPGPRGALVIIRLAGPGVIPVRPPHSNVRPRKDAVWRSKRRRSQYGNEAPARFGTIEEMGYVSSAQSLGVRGNRLLPRLLLTGSRRRPGVAHGVVARQGRGLVIKCRAQ